MKKKLKKIFDEATPNELERFSDALGAVEASDEELAAIKSKVHARLEIKKKKHAPAKLWLRAGIVAACVAVIVSVATLGALLGGGGKDVEPYDPTDIPSSDSQNDNTSEPTDPAPTDDPFCGPVNKEYDGIFVRTSIEDYVAQIEKHQSAKLVNYPTDIVAVFTQYGFTKAENISLTRIKDLEGNYFRYEELSVIYSSPDCKNDEHNSFCDLHFFAAIREDYNPVKTENYTLTDTVNGVELYEYSGPYSFSYKLFLIKVGEFVDCNISIPLNTVSEENTAKLLDQFLVIAQDMREKLLETAPEIIIAQ